VAILLDCEGLTLAGCQVPTKLLYHTSSRDGQEMQQRLLGQTKDKEVTQQLPLLANQTQVV